MDRVAQLVQASEQLSRRLFAALPVHLRMAHLLLVASVESSIAMVNRVVAAALMAAGITKDMPHVKGKPVEVYLAEKYPGVTPGKDRDHLFAALVKNPDLSGYGGDWIGKKALAIARAVVKVESRIPDLLQDFVARFYRNNTLHQLDPSKNAHQAVAFAVKAIEGMSKNELKTERKDFRRNAPMTVRDDEGGEKELEIVDHSHSIESLLANLDDVVVNETLADPQVQHKLKAIHQDAVEYIHLLMAGKQDVEILGMAGPDREIGPGLLKHPYGQMGKRLYPASWQSIKKKIMAALHDALKQRIEKEMHEQEHGLRPMHASLDDIFGAIDPQVDYSALGVSPFADGSSANAP